MTRAEERRFATLRRLARLSGVLTSYYDDKGRLQEATSDALRAVLEALHPGVFDGRNGERHAVRELRTRHWHWNCEPVVVAWNGLFGRCDLRMPASARGGVTFHLEHEDGGTREWSHSLEDLPITHEHDLYGVPHVARAYSIEGRLPLGYHKLHITGPGCHREVTIIAAPRRAYDKEDGKRWGAFLPLYALHSQSSWGAGDFTDLAAFNDWVLDSGGGLVATLPLLPTYLGEPYDPSPYSPVSRLFWNEFFVDPRRAPAFAECDEAQAMVASPQFQSEVAELRDLAFVDYRRQMRLKREVLTALARHAFAGDEAGPLQRFVQALPDAAAYARFRVEREMRAQPWSQWPVDALQPGDADGEGLDGDAYRFYVYSQYLAEQQLDELARQNHERDGQIYLDLPLGCHPDGYDSWRYRDTFAAGVACGAPPDSLFTGGQNWGFAPQHPRAIRENGYELFRAVIRHHLRFANVLRIDHVMGLHRLFWIPSELPATEGVYVHYRAEELYAILNLESHRHKATIMGENLGTVPEYVNMALDRHRIYTSYVMQYELPSSPGRPPRQPRPRSFASLNTHDMPPFAGFLEGRDIQIRRDLGVTAQDVAEREVDERAGQRKALIHTLRQEGLLTEAEPTPDELYRAALEYLSSSRARYVLINVEDFWQETEPQNIPGSSASTPNWTRRAKRPIG